MKISYRFIITLLTMAAVIGKKWLELDNETLNLLVWVYGGYITMETGRPSLKKLQVPKIIMNAFKKKPKAKRKSRKR
jgi:hypothetical protein